jgi:hypothetical protein
MYDDITRRRASHSEPEVEERVGLEVIGQAIELGEPEIGAGMVGEDPGVGEVLRQILRGEGGGEPHDRDVGERERSERDGVSPPGAVADGHGVR